MSGKSSGSSVAKKIEQLNKLVAWFESDNFVLEEAVEHFNAAQKLADEIEHDLSEVKNEIIVSKKKFDGE